MYGVGMVLVMIKDVLQDFLQRLILPVGKQTQEWDDNDLRYCFVPSSGNL